MQLIMLLSYKIHIQLNERRRSCNTGLNHDCFYQLRCDTSNHNQETNNIKFRRYFYKGNKTKALGH